MQKGKVQEQQALSIDFHKMIYIEREREGWRNVLRAGLIDNSPIERSQTETGKWH